MSEFSETYEDYMRMPGSMIRRRMKMLKKHYQNQKETRQSLK